MSSAATHDFVSAAPAAPDSSSKASLELPVSCPSLATSGAGSSSSSDASSAPAPVPAAALRLIERVERLSEQLAARPGEPLRLSLDLEGDHRVDVKVALRGGRVFADFRSDSAEMRSALAQGWEAFVRSRDGAAQRWADPVIAASTAPAPVAPAASSGAPGSDPFSSSSSGQQPAADQQRSSRQGAPGSEAAPATWARAASPSASPTPSEPAQSPRADASRLLSARA